MIVLGISRTTHGSAAAVYTGKKLYAVMEERFTRRKFDSSFPVHAIDWCLSAAGANFEDVDKIGFFYTGSNYMKTGCDKDRGYYPDALHAVPTQILSKLDTRDPVIHIRQKIDFLSRKPIEIFYIDHHLAHAASFLLSPFKESAILSIDGCGDGTSMSLWKGKDTKLTEIYRQPFPHSLGQFYETMTEVLGFKHHSDEYKVMGLAAYGNPDRYRRKLRNLFIFEQSGGFSLDTRAFSFYLESERHKYNDHLLGLLDIEPRKPDAQIEDSYKDLAAATQAVTEEVLEHVVTKINTGCDNLVYTGGVALNCLANGRVFPKTRYKKVYIPPHPGDTGLAISAAAYVYHVLEGKPRKYIYDSDFIGPKYSFGDMKATLDAAGLEYEDVGLEDATYMAADRLDDQSVVGWYYGSSEFGPRALGNRSILAAADPPNMKDKLNEKVKHRESFRPFAPAVLASHAKKLFKIDDDQLSLPRSFMLATAEVQTIMRDVLGAVTHVDGTARVQVLNKKTNPRFCEVVKQYSEKPHRTHALINTSFNVTGEPIVLTPLDALKCYMSTGIDSLVMGPFLLDKKGFIDIETGRHE